MQQKFITVTFNRAKIALRCADILYVIMSDDHCTIHMFDGSVYGGKTWLYDCSVCNQ